MEAVLIVVGLVVGLGIGGVAVYFLIRPRLAKAEADADTQQGKAEEAEGARQKLAVELAGAQVESASVAELKSSLKERDVTITSLEKDRSAMEATIIEREKALAEEREQFNTLKEQFKDQFVALSADALKDANKELKAAAETIIGTHKETTIADVRLHKQQIANLLQPVGETLKTLDKQLSDTKTERARAEGALMALIEKSAGTNEKLANALSKPVIRGTWSEMKLEVLLEGAGLVKDEDFELQVQVKDGDEIRIVDALVNLSQGRRVVIDSKNLLQHYVAFQNEEDEAAKAALLEKYRTAFRTTLKGLSLKDYAKHWTGVDMVIMFIPDEGMFMAAMETDRKLVASMFEHRVLVVNPSNLAGILRSVAHILGLERQNKNTEEIVKAGRELYGSLGILQGKISDLGGKLKLGMKSYNEIIGSFEGNVLPKTRTLNKLDVKRGPDHKELVELEPDFREFKDRTTQELGRAAAALPPGDNDIADVPGEPDGELAQPVSVSDES